MKRRTSNITFTSTLSELHDSSDSGISTSGNQPRKEITSIVGFKQAMTLATFVPDEILSHISMKTKQTWHFEGALVFSDVSGFTNLTEKYSMTGKGGTYKLSVTLNTYIGSLVEEILNNGGDVMNFSGDAFLAIWKKNDDLKMLHNVIDTCLCIQEAYGSFETDVDITLKVKIAIAFGSITFAIVGNDENLDFILLGPTILEVKEAEMSCVSGDVVLTPNAWKLCDKKRYNYNLKPDKKHVKILNIVTKPASPAEEPGTSKSERPLAEEVGTSKSETRVNARRQTTKKMTGIAKQSSEMRKVTRATAGFTALLTKSLVAVRPSVVEFAKNCNGQLLVPFIIPPVVQQVQHDQSLDYLTEMRQIVTVFVNVLCEERTPDDLVKVVDDCYSLICSIAGKCRGCVNKLSMFDKDLMFLVVFGLRGYKSQVESKNALQCAYKILKNLILVFGVKSASAGVTTGMVYCGVVGHVHRKEYSVIGGSVNKAARLMVAYEGKVTCDHQTCINSQLSYERFILQEHKQLKGFDQVGPIYEYTEGEIDTGSRLASFPLLNRDKEMKLYAKTLKTLRQVNAGKAHPSTINTTLVYEGGSRSGKTRLFDVIAAETRKAGIKTSSVLLKRSLTNDTFSTIKSILQNTFNIDPATSKQQQENLLLSVIPSGETAGKLCYLNDILNLNFPMTKEYIGQSMEERKTSVANLLKVLFKTAGNNDVFVMVVDDAHFMDLLSCEILSLVLNETFVFLVAFVNSSKLNPAKHQKFSSTLFKEGRVLWHHLDGLPETLIAPLACQILDVRGIPTDLEGILVQKCQGIPGWCEALLANLLQKESLRIVPFNHAEAKNATLTFPEQRYLTRSTPIDDSMSVVLRILCPNYKHSTSMKSSQGFLVPTYEAPKAGSSTAKSQPSFPVCIFNPTFDAKSVSTPQGVDGIQMTAVDQLEPYEQIVLKCGAVLGESFPRRALIAMLTNHQELVTAKAVQKLFDLKVWCCASGSLHSGQETESASCYCEEISMQGKTLPKYAFCEALQFRSLSVKDTTYNLLTDNQKKDLHTRVVNVIETTNYKCNYCVSEIDNRITAFVFPLVKRISSDPRVPDRRMRTRVGSEVSRKSQAVDPNCSHCELYPPQDLLKFNFRGCECNALKALKHYQLVEHTRAAGLFGKLILYLMDSGYLSIKRGENTQALLLLQEAFNLVKEKAPNKRHSIDSDISIDDTTGIPGYAQAKVQCMIGEALGNLGHFEEALQNIREAAEEFGMDFPKSELSAGLRLLMRSTVSSVTAIFRKSTLDEDKIRFYDEAAYCCCKLCDLYKQLGMWMLANLAATRSLEMAKRSHDDVVLLSACYRNVLEICQHFGQVEKFKRMEKEALSLCHNLPICDVTEEILQAVIDIFDLVFNIKLRSGELTSSMIVGFSALRLSQRLSSRKRGTCIAPRLIQNQILRKKMSEAVDLLVELRSYSEEEINISASVWYHVLCLEMLLETGFALENYHICKKYCEDLKSSWAFYMDADATQRLVTAMWLWCTRNDNRNEAAVWENHARKHEVKVESTFNSVTLALKVLECHLLNAVFLLDAGDYEEYILSLAKAKKLIQEIKPCSKSANFGKPRLWHLTGYYCRIRHRSSESEKYLKKAEKLSLLQENALEYTWISHNRKAWNGRMSVLVRDYWKERCSKDPIDWHEADTMDWVYTMYSLPLPLSYDDQAEGSGNYSI